MQARNAAESQERQRQNARKAIQKKIAFDLALKQSAGLDRREGNQRYDQFWEGIEQAVQLQSGRVKWEKYSISKGNYKTSRPLYLLSPNNEYKIAWDILISILILFSIISVPFRIGFNLEDTMGINVVDYILDALFLLDMLITMNTALYNEKCDKLETDRRVIIGRYMKFWFWIDLLSSVPMEDIAGLAHFSNNHTSAFRLVRSFRLFRLLKLGRVFRLERLNEHLEKANINPALINVLSLLLFLLGVAHLLSCFWVLLARGTQYGDSWKTHLSWLTAAELQNNSILDQYVAAFYWTMATILSIGYGDIHAETSEERLYSMFTMLLGGVLFGAIIAQISRLTEARNPTQKLVHINMTELGVYLQQKKFSPVLNTKIKAAYDYYFSKKSVLVEAGGILDDLSSSLSSKLTRLLFEKEIARISIFSRLDHKIVNQIVMNSKPFEADAGEVICDYGDVSDEVVFLLTGLVRIETKSGNRDVVAGYVTDGGFFGDFEFLTRSLRTARYSAVSKCSMISISDNILHAIFVDNYEAGLDFKNEIIDRYTVFRSVVKLPVISSDEAKARQAGRRRLGRSLKLATSANSSPTSGFSSLVLAVRSKLWVDGELQTHDNASMDAQLTQIKSRWVGQVYRYVRLDANNNSQKLVEEGSLKYLSKFNLIHPKGAFKGYWDFLIGVLIVYSVIAVPVTVAFAPNVSFGRAVFEYSVDSLFLCDVFVNFRTVYFDEIEDAYIVIPSKIVNRYLWRWFFVDFFSSVPFDSIISLTVNTVMKELSSIRLIKIIRLTRLLKLIRVMKLSRYIHAIEEKFGVSTAVFTIFYMISQVLLIGHLLACAWWALSVSISKNGWFDSPLQLPFDLRSKSSATQYVTSLYQIVTTLTTTGYGDLYPTNSSERIVMTFIMCIGASTFGYIVGSVSSLIGTINQTSAIKTERLTAISSFLTEKSCPNDLSASIMRHFRRSYSEMAAVNENIILDRLPKSIVIQIVMTEHHGKFQQIPFFKHVENKSVQIFLFKKLRQAFFDTDQYIMREGDTSNELVFFVHGTARIYHQAEMRRWRTLQHNKRRTSVSSQRRSTRSIVRYIEKASKMKLLQAENLVLTDQSALVDNSSYAISSPSDALEAITEIQCSHKGQELSTSSRKQYSHSAATGLQLRASGSYGSALRVEGITAASFLNKPRFDPITIGAENSSISSSDEDSVVEIETLVPKGYSDTSIFGSIEHVNETKSTELPALFNPDSRSQNLSASGLDPKEEPSLFQKLSRVDSGISTNSGVSTRRKATEFNGVQKRKSGARFGKLLFFGYKENKKNKGLSKITPFHLLSRAELKKRGRELVGDLGPGDFIGHGAMMCNCDLKASVRAISPCTAFVLNKNDLMELLDRHPGVGIVLQEALSKAIYANWKVKGNQYLRSHRANFLQELKRIGISRIRQSSRTPNDAVKHSSSSSSDPLVPTPTVLHRWQSNKVFPYTSNDISQENAFHNEGIQPELKDELVNAIASKEPIDIGKIDSDYSTIKHQSSVLSSARLVNDVITTRINRVVEHAISKPKPLRNEQEAHLESLLNEKHCLYDSDEEQISATETLYKFRGRKNLTRFEMHTIAKSAVIRHRSCSNLISFSSAQIFGTEGDEKVHAINSRSYHCLKRRQSFPSLENNSWRQMQHFEMFL